eukprot:SAG22_NODE_33_length_27588_cov_104.174652_25_plen_236_part_00
MALGPGQLRVLVSEAACNACWQSVAVLQLAVRFDLCGFLCLSVRSTALPQSAGRAVSGTARKGTVLDGKTVGTQSSELTVAFAACLPAGRPACLQPAAERRAQRHLHGLPRRDRAVARDRQLHRLPAGPVKAVITAFPSVSLPFLAVPLPSQRTLVAIRAGRDGRCTECPDGFEQHPVRTKALSFCCASTVFPSKTVPFRAVPLPQERMDCLRCAPHEYESLDSGACTTCPNGKQ